MSSLSTHCYSGNDAMRGYLLHHLKSTYAYRATERIGSELCPRLYLLSYLEVAPQKPICRTVYNHTPLRPDTYELGQLATRPGA